ncbi:hypothetical protein AVEN_161236-1 [Araneus ventricosus]|uniref:Uncharacterized protein n=1 Tax=Araneus ventricosus TaxID=182803 RepID=A0A4Y2QAB8_ARAVE|nr:hypothetical protein AVEN_161236-1 [Araneus ventricosus]
MKSPHSIPLDCYYWQTNIRRQQHSEQAGWGRPAFCSNFQGCPGDDTDYLSSYALFYILTLCHSTLLHFTLPAAHLQSGNSHFDKQTQLLFEPRGHLIHRSDTRTSWWLFTRSRSIPQKDPKIA